MEKRNSTLTKKFIATLLFFGFIASVIAANSDDGCLEIVPDCPSGTETNFVKLDIPFGAMEADSSKTAPSKAAPKEKMPSTKDEHADSSKMNIGPQNK